ANSRFAAIANNHVSSDSQGFKALYMGEARGSDGHGNEVTGDFSIFFDARPGGTVFLEGALLGLEFDGLITNPAVNGFTASVQSGSTDVASGSRDYYIGGSLEGKFYGSNHGAVGGTFSLEA